MPYEMGALIYTPSTAWQIFAVDQNDLHGPGSLNRFMKQAVFPRNKRDPTSFAPPRFALAGTFPSAPMREDIDTCIDRAAYLLSKAAENPTSVDGDISLQQLTSALSKKLEAFPPAVETRETAIDVLSITAASNFDAPSGSLFPQDISSKLSSAARVLMSSSTPSTASESIAYESSYMGVVDMMAGDASEGKTVKFQNQMFTLVACSSIESGDVGSAYWRTPSSNYLMTFSSQNKRLTLSGVNYGPFPLEFTGYYQEDKMSQQVLKLRFQPAKVFALLEVPFQISSTIMTAEAPEEKDKPATKRVRVQFVAIESKFALSVAFASTSSSSAQHPIFSLWLVGEV